MLSWRQVADDRCKNVGRPQIDLVYAHQTPNEAASKDHRRVLRFYQARGPPRQSRSAIRPFIHSSTSSASKAIRPGPSWMGCGNSHTLTLRMIVTGCSDVAAAVAFLL